MKLKLFIIALMTFANLPSMAATASSQTLPKCEDVSKLDSAPVTICSSQLGLEKASLENEESTQLLQTNFEDDILTIALKSTAQSVILCCDFQHPMAFDKERALWHIALKGKHLNYLDLEIITIIDGRPENHGHWSGPKSTVLPKIDIMQPELIKFKDKTSGEEQSFSVLKPNLLRNEPINVLYMSDGETLASYSKALDADNDLRINGRKTVVIGIWSSKVDQIINGVKALYSRSDEYLFREGEENTGFSAHNRMFIENARPWIENEILKGHQIESRYLLGQSDGAAWALITSIQNPKLFAGVFALSPTFQPLIGYTQVFEENENLNFRFYYGSLEQEAMHISQKISCSFKGKNLNRATPYSIPGGHSPTTWNKAFIEVFSDEPNRIYSVKTFDCKNLSELPKPE